MYTSTLLATLALAYPSFAHVPSSQRSTTDLIQEPDSSFTSGFAQYVSKDEALSSGLAKYTDNKVRIGVDSNNTYSLSSTGRKSVRLHSKNTFDNGLLIADFAHLPVAGCGMWPAFWVYTGEGSTVSEYSEIDIVENVNQATANSHSFYTGQQCTVNINRGDSVRTDNCHYELGMENAGCSFMAEEGTFGNAFNQNGYQVVALQVEADGIKIWHFKNGEVPSDLNSANPNPNTWANPTVSISPKSCDFNKAFSRFHVIINITFCGGWAGGEDWNGQCAAQTGQSSCNAWVAGNPDNFDDTYWDINSVKLFQK
ncbi:glycoside hydrolase family 16 protein [Lentithecium fluviatile CBS 122367]|uniref:Glycoside hydrolase family 16 protein n=1 Tax=Lentithecium fluviatile CBS 122367 TaxID=1168545 RepID=A0A6G1IM20_9PLEO|nr:glycoside hydrolase family 16 protein [Lentithecium fluviatile CBS 122367]